MTGRLPLEGVDRALSAIEALAAAGPDGVSLSRLASTIGVPKASAHRVLSALRAREFATQDPTTGTYALGPAALTVGERYLDHDRVAATHPALVALGAATGELVNLGILAGVSVVYLEKIEPSRPIRVHSAVGRPMPAATTALGRALLVPHITSPTHAAAYVGGDEEAARRLVEAVDLTRTRGFATEFGENETDVGCVAVALRRGERSVAAISVTMPVERLDEERATELDATIREVVPPLLPLGMTLGAPHLA